MTGEEIVKRLIADRVWTLRTVIEARKPGNHYHADEFEWTTYHLVMDVVKLAYGFTTAEAERFIKITTGEV